MARRIYKGCTIEHRLNLPVSNIDDLEYLSILLHTKGDNDIIKTYPNDIAFKNDEFIFTISSDDIVFLKEGILWATIDMRVSGVDTNKKIQLPYYIKYREGAASSILVTIEDVETVVDEKMGENFDAKIEEKVEEKIGENLDVKIEGIVDEKFGVLINDVDNNTNDIKKLKNRVYNLEEIDHSKYLTKHQTLKTINGESIVGEGNIVIEGGTGGYDDTELKNRVSALEGIDHSQYLTEHQTLKTINGESLVGDGNIVIEGGTGYDDTELKNRVSALEQKEDKDTIYDDTELKNRVSALESIDHSKYLTEHQTLKTINGESLVGNGNIVIEGGTGGTSIPSLQFQGYYAEKDGFPRILANYVGDYDGVVNAIENNSPFLLTYKTDNNGQDGRVLDHHSGIYQPVSVTIGQIINGQSFINADFMCVSSHPGDSSQGVGEKFEYFTLSWNPVWQSYYVNHMARYEYDNKLNTASHNAVENRVVTSYINAIITALNNNGIEVQLNI